MSLIVNRRDLDFMMYEVLGLDELLQDKRYQDYDREAIDAILDITQTIAEDVFLPFAAKLDANEPEFIDGKVKSIPEVRKALDAYQQAGLFGTCFDADLGGMQLPWMVHQALNGILTCANGPVVSYAFLTQGAANLLNAKGSQTLKKKYLSKMIAGDWFGTMCLSEPHAGSSLGDIRTKAELIDDTEQYKITGTKMWISGGDQDLSDNIIHMVLAKIPGAPAGVKGISLFLVPKVRVNDDGTLGDFNNIALAGLNHKMGNRGTTNCLLNFGEQGETVGFLIGQENQGLMNMFHMMNEARIGVGMGAMIAGLGGYLYSLDYARNRPQGRALGNKDPATPQVMIAQHADVKRMLMTQKVFVEGAQCLILYCAQLLDNKNASAEQAEITRNALLLEILTPICKSWPSEFCLEANKLAIQVLGGYGYTRDYPVERYYRDNRLNHIHEGTWAIHGIDILGRKVTMHDGAALKVLVSEIKATIDSVQKSPELIDLGEQLAHSLKMIEKTLLAVSQSPDANEVLANATIFLDAFGHVVIAWQWLRQASAAMDGKANSEAKDADFYDGKLAACDFFFRYELPNIQADLELVASLDRTCLDLPVEQLIGC